MSTQHHAKNQTIIIEKVKRIMNINSVKRVSVNRNIDQKGKDGDSLARMRYGGIIRKPDRLLN